MGGAMTKKAIIIGATSGIGKALAEALAADGYSLGITGRREELLATLKEELGGKVRTCVMDVNDTAAAMAQFKQLTADMDGVDLVIISAGIGHPNPKLDPALELDTINTNVSGFVALADVAYSHFMERGGGHLVGLSSIAALRGMPVGPSYSASKAFVSNYMEGLRIRALKEGHGITVTDVRPGFVDTAMAKGEGLFWVAPPEKAAQQILSAIKARKAIVYITRRWRLVAWLLKMLPTRMLAKL